MSFFVPSGPVLPPTALPHSERRAKVRYTCRVKSTWRPLGSPSTAWDAIVQDVSESGLRLLMGMQHKRGTILSVNVECGHERFSKGILVRVTRCQPLQEGLWNLGCSFIKPLKEKELLALLQSSAAAAPEQTIEPLTAPPATGGREKGSGAPACRTEVADASPSSSRPNVFQAVVPPSVAMSASGSPEKRRTPRRGSNLAVVQITRPGSWSKSVEGWVVNKSLGGMCLCSPRKFDTDTILEITPKRQSGSNSTLELRVVQVRSEGARYMLHCQFTKHPPAQVLRLFG
jgi:hypothetical protein